MAHVICLLLYFPLAPCYSLRSRPSPKARFSPSPSQSGRVKALRRADHDGLGARGLFRAR
jgi:hypothetical protein